LPFAQLTNIAQVSRWAWRCQWSQRKPPESVGRGVAFLARILRIVLWLVIATWLGRKLLGWLFNPGTKREVSPASPLASKPLYRDPWCGTHVSSEISFPLEQGAQLFHFCSAECRERYRASQRRAAGG